MPKGAALHIHLDSGASFEWYIQNATYRSDCYIKMNNSDINNVENFEAISFFPSNIPSRTGDTSDLDSWYPANQLRQEAANVQGNPLFLHPLIIFEF